MRTTKRYLEIDVAGPPRELGRQVGDAVGERIRAFCAIALDRVNLMMAIRRESAMEVARESISIAEKYSPDTIAEMRGMAESAKVALDELMLLQVRNQLKSDDAGCTSFSLGRMILGHRIVAQNWDADPMLDEFTVVLTRRPLGKPAFTTVTQVGLVAYIGFNAAGIGLCLNTLPAPSRRRGVPHYFLVRAIYEATDLEQAVTAVRCADRAIPANIMLTTPQGPANLEVTLDAVKILTEEDAGTITHTNHCRHPDLVSINDSFPELIQSYTRQKRIDELLRGTNVFSRSDNSSSPHAGIQAVLRDHEGFPRSICRHANDDRPTGFWETVFSVIIEPEKRQLHISRGTPCSHPYETYVMK